MNITQSEIIETLIYEGKDTVRKQKLFLNKWLEEVEYIFEHINIQLNSKQVAWYLGKQYTTTIHLENEIFQLKKYLKTLN